MPRVIKGNRTPDQMDAEIDHTEDMLEAAGLAEQAQRVATWRAPVEAWRGSRKALGRRRSKMNARRQLAVRRLKKLCKRFSNKLLAAVEQDRTNPLYKTYFSVSPTELASVRLADRVRTVRAWAAHPHPALEPLQADLLGVCDVIDASLQEEAAIDLVGQQVAGEGDAVAKQLTEHRDELHRELAALAPSRGEERDWAGEFFQVGKG
jgi:hypothetical protein